MGNVNAKSPLWDEIIENGLWNYMSSQELIPHLPVSMCAEFSWMLIKQTWQEWSDAPASENIWRFWAEDLDTVQGPPYYVVHTARNLPARIGDHLPLPSRMTFESLRATPSTKFSLHMLRLREIWVLRHAARRGFWDTGRLAELGSTWSHEEFQEPYNMNPVRLEESIQISFWEQIFSRHTLEVQPTGGEAAAPSEVKDPATSG